MNAYHLDSASASPDRRLSVAPMMDCTDRFARYLLRLISRRTLLYTEMVPAAAIVHGRAESFLPFSPEEHPVAIQFGGADPAELAVCADKAYAYGYDEINLNVGCPSDRVQSGNFGACLMAHPALVADCVAAMMDASPLPVTVKTRIGIDDKDSWEFLCEFVDTVARAGCRSFTVHARKAWLQGLSPRQNREIPALDHARVHALKSAYPELEIIINGGIRDLDEAAWHLERVDGVMIGREAYHNPYMLARADARIFGDANANPPSRHEVLAAYLPFVEAQLQAGVRFTAISRHLLGLFQGMPGARAWRRHISENAHHPGAGTELLASAAALVQEPAVAELAG